MFWRDDDKLLTRYLLGELPERRLPRLERKLLAEAAFFERLQIVEDDLIDAYLREELTAARRQRFEKRFLRSPQWRARIELARSLLSVADGSSSEAEARFASALSLRWPAFVEALAGFRLEAVVPAAAALALVGLVLLWQPWTPSSFVPEGGHPAAKASVVLLPAVRSEAVELPRLELTGTTRAVELKAYVGDAQSYPVFRATLKGSLGEVLWSSSEGSEIEFSDAARTIVVRPPAEILRAGRLSLELVGEDAAHRFDVIGEYEFEVVRDR